MKKYVLLVVLFFNFPSAFSQETFKYLPSYSTEGRMEFKVGDEIELGYGAMADKSFVTIFTSPYSIKGNKNLGAEWARHKFKIKEIRQYGKLLDFRTYLVIGSIQIENYFIDIEHSIINGEVVIPDRYKDRFRFQFEQSSIADELIKLKQLLNDSLLTKEEFDLIKIKLLKQ